MSDTPEDLSIAAADLLADVLGETPTTFGLAGGSTPVATYRILRERRLDWGQITCWLPDERWVPPEDPESNALMARRELTDPTGAPLIAPDTMLTDPEQSAVAYERLLGSEFGDGPDLVLLGMGSDGHTASLFPGTDALGASEPGYVATWVDALGTWRLTATAPLLHAATRIVFLVSGEAKAPVLRSVLVDEEPLPAQVVAAGAKDVTWLLDGEAAALL